MKNYLSQQRRALSNFQSLATEVGGQAIPGMTKAMKDLGGSSRCAELVAPAWLDREGDQKDIVDDVKGVEKWIVGHRGDWVALRGDMHDLWKAAQGVGPALGDARPCRAGSRC